MSKVEMPRKANATGKRNRIICPNKLEKLHENSKSVNSYASSLASVTWQEQGVDTLFSSHFPTVSNTNCSNKLPPSLLLPPVLLPQVVCSQLDQNLSCVSWLVEISEAWSWTSSMSVWENICFGKGAFVTPAEKWLQIFSWMFCRDLVPRGVDPARRRYLCPRSNCAYPTSSPVIFILI